MFGLSGLPLYGGIAALIAIVALIGALWVQTNRVEAKQETIKALNLIADEWEAKVEAKNAKIDELRETIAQQNEEILNLAELGRLAEERQRVIDELMSELARAEDDLVLISNRYREIRDQSIEWNVCETYAAVFRSIAFGGAP